jgi:aspartyl-tRNA synthetase
MLKTRTNIKDTPNQVGKEVNLYGWVDSVRDHGKVGFIDLRDITGIIQVVFYGDNYEKIKDLGPEYVVKIVGNIKERGKGQENENIETGKIEVDLKEVKVLNKSKDLPIPIDTDGTEINEDSKLKYRYIDLRREYLKDNIKTRSKFTFALREALIKEGFNEIETPILTKSTKEGARDFLVPSRMQPGKFYALPQSPQQYKQLLMVAGFEKYFQLARCIRDEDLRADRGFEHTQLDLEASFVEQSDIFDIVEKVLSHAIPLCGGNLKQDKFPVLTYDEVIKTYGDDKFDIRTEQEKKDGVLAFAWVTDYPMFKKVDKEDAAEVRDGISGYTFTHNPFSGIQKESEKDHLNQTNIENIKATQYDLVCNGYEIASGSIRAYKREVLESTFKIMGYDKKRTEENIGHILEAFDYGTPPHGGIALGIERLIMLLAGTKSLKDTIAFPMSSRGKTSVMNAPSEVNKEQLDELGIKVK